MAQYTIEEILKNTTDLPSLPAAALMVMKEADSPTSSAHTIAEYLVQDQALTARVLRLSNSAFYGLSRQVTSAQESVVVLGTRTVRNLCLVAATYPWLSKPLAGYSLGPEALFSHAMAVAVGCQQIADVTGKIRREDAFTAGLLHNIGKVALSVFLENKTQGLQVILDRTNQTYDEVERMVFGVDHAEVGAVLAESWNLPKSLVQAIRYHHHPDQANPSNPMVDAVHVGDFMAMSMGYGLGGDGLQYEFQDSSLERLGLDVAALEELAGNVVELYDRYQMLFQEGAKAA